VSNYPQRRFQVRYPDGEKVFISAHQIILADNSISLKKAPGDNPGNIVFTASHEAGVTITQVSEEL